MHAGPEATVELAALGCDVVLNAVAGAQGLRATLASLEAGLVVALANKESLIAGGPLVTAASRARVSSCPSTRSTRRSPSACGPGRAVRSRKLVLTASGGPFRGRRRDELADVTPAEALAHPTWDMGTLVTTNSATLVNKGLELIEAHLLFDIPYDRIDVVVHPQSIIHSMVEFTDGSTIAQASPPDMRLPIALALGWPDRVPGASAAVDWTTAQSWTFEPLDPTPSRRSAWPGARARQAAAHRRCSTRPTRTLVAAFHDGSVGFLRIVDTVRDVLDEWLRDRHDEVGNPGTVVDVEQAQDWAAGRARALTADR